jgi:peptide/nickel transport system permease protein
MTDDSTRSLNRAGTPTTTTEPPATAFASSRGLTTRLVRAARSRRSSLLGIALVALFVATGILAPIISPHSPYLQDLSRRLVPPAWLSGGSLESILGADQLGRDLLSRVIYGAQVSLAVSTATVLVAGTIGVIVGSIAGYFGGLWDDLIMRVVDMQLAFPFVLLAILVAAFLGPSLTNMVIVLVFASWVIYARMARGAALEIRERDFIAAARVTGCSSFRILTRHILPNIITPVLVVASLQVGQVILAEATLSFVGLGVEPRTPAWGSMLYQGREYLTSAWWLSVFPGLAITLAVLGANLVGDWLRDAFDPRLQLL